MDRDGDTDFDDISPFVLGLNDPSAYLAGFGVPPAVHGDTDEDGDLDFDDIEGFVDLLSGGAAATHVISVPEPSGISLCLAGLLGGGGASLACRLASLTSCRVKRK
jgi:hypothetical protein